MAKYIEVLLATKICKLSLFLGYDTVQFVSNHKDLFARYVNVDTLVEMLRNSDSEKEACGIIWKAYELAGSQIEGAIIESQQPLASVFSRVSINDDTKDYMHYSYARLTPDNAVPNDLQTYGKIENLRKQFEGEIALLANNAPDLFENFEIVLDMIFQKYLWCINVSDNSENDVSLYDLSKVATAIATCLVRTEENKPYCFVMGDFSGIQKYIFEVATVNDTGVAKRLRARSFYVDSIIRICAQYILDEFELNRDNILLQTGGKFYLLVPNDARTLGRLEETCKAMEKHFASDFQKMISVNVVWECVDETGIVDYSSTIVRLTQKLENKRNNPFSTLLHQESEWCEEEFVLYHSDMHDKHLCSCCHSKLISVKEDECWQCRLQEKIGQKLANARYIVYRRTDVESGFSVLGRYQIEVTNQKDFENAYLVEVLNQTKIEQEDYQYPINQRYMVNHVPQYDNKIFSFSEIAQNAKGNKKLAVLKADVDVLGYLFADGFRMKNVHYGTISRVSTMSRMLEVFFCGQINELLNEQDYKYVYSVFSGGDDLFLIGPWNVMMELALRIRDKFKLFCAQNRDINISAAIVQFHSKEHIATVAEWSEDHLEHAKNSVNEVLYPGKCGRNSISFFGEVMSWEDYRKQLENVRVVTQQIERKAVSSGILHRLSKYSEMYRSYVVEDVVDGLMCAPYFQYDERRNYRGMDEAFKTKYLKPMFVNVENKERLNRNLYFARCVIDVAMKMTR